MEDRRNTAFLLALIFSVLCVSCVSAATTSTGTGFIVSADGYIITNEHVIHSANAVTVSIEGTIWEATIIEASEENDLALLRIDAANLIPVMLGNSLSVGLFDEVFAFGYPIAQYGRDLTVSQGMITSVRTNVPGREGRDTFQHDAVIFHGSSGGPLFNSRGEVIGVNYAAVSGSGLEFAIPIADVIPLLRKVPGFDVNALGQAGEQLSPQEIYTRYAASVVLIEADVTISLRELIPENIPGYEGEIVDVDLSSDISEGFTVLQAAVWTSALEQCDWDSARTGNVEVSVLAVEFGSAAEAVRAQEAGHLWCGISGGNHVLHWETKDSYWESIGTISASGNAVPCSARLVVKGCDKSYLFTGFCRWYSFVSGRVLECSTYPKISKFLSFGFISYDNASIQAVGSLRFWSILIETKVLFTASQQIFVEPVSPNWPFHHYGLREGGTIVYYEPPPNWPFGELTSSELICASSLIAEFESVAKYVFSHVLSSL